MNRRTRMAIRGIALAPITSLVLMGASECSKGESCGITGRDTTTITMVCTDRDDNTKETRTERHPSDLYPNCQIGTYWPGCKGR